MAMGYVLHDLTGIGSGNLLPTDPKSPATAAGWRWLHVLQQCTAEPTVKVPVKLELSGAQMSIPVQKVRSCAHNTACLFSCPTLAPLPRHGSLSVEMG